MRDTLRIASALAVIAFAGGCAAPEHLGAGFGRSYDAAFAAQAVRPPDKEVAQAATGLDTQEATIVWESYRRSLAPKGQASKEEEPILFIAPQPRTSPQANLPPPSVPPSSGR